MWRRRRRRRCAVDGFIGCVESCTEAINCIGSIAAIFASPLAFPCIFLFPSEREDNYGNEWDVAMLRAPCAHPCMCCFAMVLPPCAQMYLRSRVLDGDMSKYKCCQGYMDGPYCCAACHPKLPFTFEAGKYGERQCPWCCLCIETHCCLLTSFEVSRGYQRQERFLKMDPTEVRVDNCLEFFGTIADMCACASCCACCCGCACQCCCGMQEEGDAMLNLSAAMANLARSIYRGMMYTIYIAMCCMSAQMCHEAGLPIPPRQDGVPIKKPGDTLKEPVRRRGRHDDYNSPPRQHTM